MPCNAGGTGSIPRWGNWDPTWQGASEPESYNWRDQGFGWDNRTLYVQGPRIDFVVNDSEGNAPGTLRPDAYVVIHRDDDDDEKIFICADDGLVTEKDCKRKLESIIPKITQAVLDAVERVCEEEGFSEYA